MAVTGFLPKRNASDKIITITGNLGSDPELAYAKNGNAYARFNMACTSGPKDKEETQWYRVTSFGQQAENIVQSLTKGDRVIVRGRYEETVLPANEKYPQERTVYGVTADTVGISLLWKPAQIVQSERIGRAMSRGAARKNVQEDGFEDEEPF